MSNAYFDLSSLIFLFKIATLSRGGIRVWWGGLKKPQPAGGLHQQQWQLPNAYKSPEAAIYIGRLPLLLMSALTYNHFQSTIHRVIALLVSSPNMLPNVTGLLLLFDNSDKG